MSSSLPIGQWMWNERWRYPDQEGEHPSMHQKPRLSKSMGNGQTKPFRRTLVGAPLTTDYRESIVSAADESKKRALSASQAKGLDDGKAKSKTDSLVYHHLDPFFHMTEEQKKQIKPEERSWWLWSRINAMHCVQPYQSDYQHSFINHTADKDPLRKHLKGSQKLPKIEQSPNQAAIQAAQTPSSAAAAGGAAGPAFAQTQSQQGQQGSAAASPPR